MSSEQRKQKAILEMMTAEQLEELLRQDAQAEDSQLSGEDILEIMEVIERKKNEIEKPQTDGDAAWRDFKENYLGKAALYVPDMDEETDSRPADSSRITPEKKASRSLRTALIATVLIVALCTTAVGKDLFRTIADWTRETFSFRDGEENREIVDVFSTLRNELNNYGDLQLIPAYAPKGTVEIDSATATMQANKTRLMANYQTPDGEFYICILLYDTKPEKYLYTYEKNDAAIAEEYVANGIVHQIVRNDETNTVVWAYDTAECSIHGNLSVDELKKMVDSIYE